ncbi:MAG: 2,3,4,5-tetrahydropyridine-2,6-dicarboxylate N-succinyltransferase, partial [Cytophagales bacterium]
MELRDIIENAWNDRSLLTNKEVEVAIKTVVDELDRGVRRVAEPSEQGEWLVNEWVKKAVILYFPLKKMVVMESGPFE